MIPRKPDIDQKNSMLKGLVGTQLLAAVFGLAYVAILDHRNHPNPLSIGLRIWGYLAALFLLLHVFLALKQWWKRLRKG